jgi:PDZ domain-containing secreted protein
MQRCIPYLLVLLVFSTCRFNALVAQHELKVNGQITEYESTKSLKSAQVTVENTLNRQAFSVVAKNGRYKLKLEYQQVYHLIYSADGFYSKIIEVDTRDIPLKNRKVLSMKIDVDLLQQIVGFDARVFYAPVSKAVYKYNTDNLGWDTDYYRKRLNEIETERKRALQNINPEKKD